MTCSVRNLCSDHFVRLFPIEPLLIVHAKVALTLRDTVFPKRVNIKRTVYLESTKYNIMTTVISLTNEKLFSLSSNTRFHSMVVYLYVKDPVDFSGVNQEQTSRYTEGNQPILGTVQNKNCLHGKLN